MARFVGKSVVVLGGSTGIGAATVRRFLQEGAEVLLGDINDEGERVTTEDQRQFMLNTLHSTRIGSPDDIAGMVLHLCSDDGHYFNGQSISINGGTRM